MPTYNKLVRDNIPAIIENTGKKYRTKTLSETDYIKELKVKIGEELEEYLEAADNGQALEELADMLEIMHSLAKVHGASMEKVEAIRAQKAQKRGGFRERIFLIDVEDE